MGQRFSAAHSYLMRLDDLFCAKLAIKEFVAACCKQKRMEPILSANWQPLSESASISFDEWSAHLLRKTNNVRNRVLSYATLIEATLYALALTEHNCHDSLCFDLLFALSMANGAYDAAAKYMFEYALRIETYVERKTAATQKLQFHCLGHALSAMDLLSDHRRFLLIDFAMPPQTKIFPSDKVVSYAQLKKFYVLLQSKECLKSTDCIDLSIEETANAL